ncbi:MAG: YhcH/YjgK/YiaL family protein [Nanoarchaeota archaeon]
MISGDIEDLHLHLRAEIVQPILGFLQNTTIDPLQTEKYTLPQGIFAIAIKTNSRSLKGQQFEAHRKHLDLHYLVSGKEVLGFTSDFGLEISKPYASEEDCLLYHHPPHYSKIILSERQFVLFYPEDVHCAKGNLHDETIITKIVFKIPIPLLK